VAREDEPFAIPPARSRVAELAQHGHFLINDLLRGQITEVAMAIALRPMPVATRHHQTSAASCQHSGRKPFVDNRLPTHCREWYDDSMSGTHTVVVGDRGRIVVPAAIRARGELAEGTPLVLLDTPGGIVLMTRAQLRLRVRDELAGLDLVDELLRDRRNHARAEDDS